MSYIEGLVEGLLKWERYDVISEIVLHFPYKDVYNRIHDLENIRKLIKPNAHNIENYYILEAAIKQLKEENGHDKDFDTFG
jgi:hypothetical protein